MKISIVSDEISSDFETAVELGVKWGIHDFELRGVGESRVPNLSDFQREKIQRVLENYQARIIALSPGLFKIPCIPAERPRFPVEAFDSILYQDWKAGQNLMKFHLEELLPATIDYARQLGVSLIVIFSFDRGGLSSGNPPEEVVDYLRKASQQADASGIQLAIEVEKGFWGDTGERTADLIRQVGHPALGVNWDPANALEAGDIPIPDGYQAARHLVRHVHFKDLSALPEGGFRYVVEGDIDWLSQIQELYKDEYQGYISVETHMAPKVQSAKLVVERLLSLVA
jgi:sugar phosphate isomerase/epimerase